MIPLSLRAFKGEGEKRTEAEVGAEAPTSASSSVLGRKGGGRSGCSVVGFGFALCSVWFVGFWVGDGRSGTRMQDLFGTYADATSIGGCPAVSPRMPWGTCRCRGRPWVGHIHPPHQRSTAVRDGISARCRRGRMEPHKGAKALDNEPIDSQEILGEG